MGVLSKDLCAWLGPNDILQLLSGVSQEILMSFGGHLDNTCFNVRDFFFRYMCNCGTFVCIVLCDVLSIALQGHVMAFDVRFDHTRILQQSLSTNSTHMMHRFRGVVSTVKFLVLLIVASAQMRS